MPRAGKIVFITIAVWLVVTVFYGYYWVSSILARPDNYGYEKWVMLPLLGFLVYRFPYLVVGLLLIILTELVLTELFRRKAA